MQKKKLYLRRHKADKPLDKKYGYSWQNRTDICQGWIVRGLYRNSAACEAGLEIGDTIISVNGRDGKNYTWDEEDDLSKFPRQELNIISASGKQKYITLEAKEYW